MVFVYICINCASTKMRFFYYVTEQYSIKKRTCIDLQVRKNIV